MHLYAIDQRILAVITSADESGEIDPNYALVLDALEMERKDKLTGMVAAIRDAEAKSAAIDAEIARLTELQRPLLMLVNRFKEYIYASMKATGESKIDLGPLGRPRIQRNSNPTVKFTGDVDMLEGRFKRITVEVDKKAILEAFKREEQVPDGVSVEYGDHLRM